jgi:hypothetical protein
MYSRGEIRKVTLQVGKTTRAMMAATNCDKVRRRQEVEAAEEE